MSEIKILREYIKICIFQKKSLNEDWKKTIGTLGLGAMLSTGAFQGDALSKPQQAQKTIVKKEKQKLPVAPPSSNNKEEFEEFIYYLSNFFLSKNLFSDAEISNEKVLLNKLQKILNSYENVPKGTDLSIKDRLYSPELSQEKSKLKKSSNSSCSGEVCSFETE